MRMYEVSPPDRLRYPTDPNCSVCVLGGSAGIFRRWKPNPRVGPAAKRARDAIRECQERFLIPEQRLDGVELPRSLADDLPELSQLRVALRDGCFVLVKHGPSFRRLGLSASCSIYTAS